MKNDKKFPALFISAVFCMAVQGCKIEPAYQDDSTSRHTVGYVSASKGPSEYVSSTQKSNQYVSATPSEEEMLTAFTEAQQEDTPAEQANTHFDMNNLWGHPPDTVGRGLTLLDKPVRVRFNDALNSTPVGSTVRWQRGRVQFVFLPNSPIYNAHNSGGRCRDGILIVYDKAEEKRRRGLFCQSGPGADWFLLD